MGELEHELGDELDDGNEPDDGETPAAGGETKLSQHPEAKRARARRRKARKKSSSSSSSSKSAGGRLGGSMRTRIGEAIDELASALERRDPELAEVLHRDGPKMAELLGRWADHPKAPPFVKVAVAFIAEVLEPLRAFGATFRILLRRMRDRQLARQEAEAAELGYPEQAAPLEHEPAGEGEPFVVDRGTPDRFRADGS